MWRPNPIALILGAVFVALSPAACVTSKLEPGNGYRFDVTGPDYPAVWDAAVVAVGRIVQTAQLDKKSGRVTGNVLSGTGPESDHVEQLVAVWITPAQPGAASYAIEVQSQQASPLNVIAPDWTGQIVAAIRDALGQG